MTPTPRSLLASVGAVRTEMYRGREHLVIPVVATMAGVVHASGAPHPELITTTTLQQAAASFNGRPLLIGHPTKDGAMASANDAATWERAFGQTFNARMVGHKLVVDAYCDIEKATAVGGPEFVTQLRDSTRPMEVSIGAFVQTEDTSGIYGGKRYASVWHSSVGDHLAFLPHSTGACSVRDGCGTHRAAEEHRTLPPGSPWPSSMTKQEVATELRKAVAEHSAAHPMEDPYAAARPKDVTLPPDYSRENPPNPYAKETR